MNFVKFSFLFIALVTMLVQGKNHFFPLKFILTTLYEPINPNIFLKCIIGSPTKSEEKKDDIVEDALRNEGIQSNDLLVENENDVADNEELYEIENENQGL